MKLSRKQWIPIGIVLLFILTNPSVSAFKAYLGKDSYQGLKRPLNFFICSIYKDHQRQFFGVLGNFIDVEKREVVSVDNAPVGDSAKMADSSSMKANTGLPSNPLKAYNELPYRDRVYFALKDNLANFKTSKDEFENKLKDRNYAMKVYNALKENISGFNKKPDQFIKAIND